MNTRRSVYMVLGIQAIGYAELAISSLLRNCRDDIALTLITDTAEDRCRYEVLVAAVAGGARVQVADEAACDARAEVVFRDHPNVRAFRKGHPCWRKVTDPSLFAAPGSEIIVLDPDLYFPNAFHFEPTPPGQLLLMSQIRHCLLPPEIVRRAFRYGIELAHHTDIGVAQHRELPWDWIETVIERLGGHRLPRVPHVESIVWAAIAMRVGGGYLCSSKWRCWERTAGKRLLMLLGFGGPNLLRLEEIARRKCFHASSCAKEWMAEAAAKGILRSGRPQLMPVAIRPYVQLTAEEHKRLETQRLRYHRTLRRLRLTDPLALRQDLRDARATREH